MINETIAHYRITSKLGQGGMGEVYRATDTKLDRDVAIKVLPDEFADDPKRLARFEREAKALAKLNHAGIGAIHGFEEHQGKRYLVLELVEGKTLAQRLERGPLAIEETLSVGQQIAEALQSAHSKGIIHRDLKPDNVKITPDGQVKVLDFGIAKAIVENLPPDATTLTGNVTLPGTLLGTVAYMSPEQARGNPVDKRSDIWSLGCVLYECLAGKQTFNGDSSSEIIGAVMHEEPDWSLLPANTPRALHRALRRCLAKDAKHRLHDVADARLEIEAALSEPAPEIAGLASSSDAARVPSWRRYFPWCVAACMLLLAAFFYLRDDTGSQARELFHIALPADQPYALSYLDNQTSIAISSDGRRIAYVGWGPRGKQLFLRELNQWESVPIEGTEDARSPFFSPDSERLAFSTIDQLKVVSLRTHEIDDVLHVLPVTAGGCWESKDTILFLPTPVDHLMRIHVDTRKSIVAFTNEIPNRRLASPKMLPDGKSVLLTVVDPDESSAPGLAVVDLETEKLKKLPLHGTSPHYDPQTHRLVFCRGGNILSVAFDLNRRKVLGEPDVIDTGVIQRKFVAELTVSANGKLVYAPGSGTSGRKLVRVNPPESDSHVLAIDAFDLGVSLSPGKQLLAIPREDSDGNTDIYVFDLARERWDHRLTFSKKTDGLPVWTPDGGRITYSSWGNGDPELFRKELGGASDSAKRLLEKPVAQFPTSWSPNGKTLAFTHEDPNTHYDIWLLHLDESDQVQNTERFVATDHVETGAVFSPDEQWIAYQSNESGRFEIYVEPFPRRKGARVTLTTDGGTEPVWARDKERLRLFYRNGKRMMAVDFLGEPKAHPGEPEVLFPGQYHTGAIRAYYDVTADGQFLMIQLAEGESPEQLNVIDNWHAGLKGD